MILTLWLVSGTYIAVKPCGESDIPAGFRDAVNASVGKREMRVFRHIGTDGQDLGPIAVDMDKVAFIAPIKDKTE